MAGIMSKPTGNPSSSILEDFRNRLATTMSRDPETLLASMPEDKQNAILYMARQVERIMRFSRDSAAEAMTSLYANADPDHRKIVLALLNSEEERFTPTEPMLPEWEALKPIEELLAESKAFRTSRNKAVDQTAAALAEPQERADFVRDTGSPATGNDDLTNITLALIASESSGKPRAEYVADDGSRYSGALQIGAMRLADANAALGTNYSQDDLINDQAIQNTVNDWHMRDLAWQVDSYIESLGDRGRTVSRTGAIAAAHISGMGGLARLVESNFEDNPTDELGGSALGYYQRFSRSN